MKKFIILKQSIGKEGSSYPDTLDSMAIGYFRSYKRAFAYMENDWKISAKVSSKSNIDRWSAVAVRSFKNEYWTIIAIDSQSRLNSVTFDCIKNHFREHWILSKTVEQLNEEELVDLKMRYYYDEYDENVKSKYSCPDKIPDEVIKEFFQGVKFE